MSKAKETVNIDVNYHANHTKAKENRTGIPMSQENLGEMITSQPRNKEGQEADQRNQGGGNVG